MNKSDSNVIKGIAVIMLYIHHLYHSDRWKNYEISWGVSPERIISIAVFCKICVATFAFVSVYGITRRYMDISGKEMNYLWKDALIRYIKLIFSHWLIFFPALLLSFFIKRHTFQEIYFVSQPYTHVLGIKYFFFDVFGLAYLFGTPTYNTTWWYLTLAILLIVIVPLINKIYDKIGFFIIPGIIFFAVCFSQLSFKFYGLTRYCVGIGIAIVMAREKIIEKIKCFLQKKILFSILLTIVFTILFYLGFILRTYGIADVVFIDNIEAAILVLLCASFFLIPGTNLIKNVLEVLGKYSSNMYMLHGFIVAFFFEEFTYSFKNVWLILFVLILDTFSLSFVIEYAKNKFGYYKILNNIKDKFL